MLGACWHVAAPLHAPTPGPCSLLSLGPLPPFFLHGLLDPTSLFTSFPTGLLRRVAGGSLIQ